MKKITILFTLMSIFISGYTFAASAHDIHIEWSYTQPNDGRVLAGYNLYMEGAKVCTSNNPTDSSIDCIVQADDGTYDFTLTSFFTDNTETAHSTSYSFTLIAASAHDIHIEWSYTQPNDGRVLAGYNLYMEGAKVCTSNNPEDSSIDCTVQAEDGEYDFTLTSLFTDSTESSHSEPYSFSLVSGSEPALVASISTTPLSLTGDIPLSVAFDATASTGNIASYAWSFGDSSTGNGSQASHTYTTVGTYTATLIITSSTGDTSQNSVAITTTSPPIPPTANISSSALSGDAPHAISFNGSGSTGDITSYAWTFGDNGTGSGSQVSHSYTTPGTYTATLVATGPAGTSQDSVTVTVSTPPVAPSAVISSSSLTGDAPLTVSFNGSGSTGDITSYSWTFGDNSSGSGSQISHSYTTPGTHTATLTTTGPAGTSQDSVTVTVSTPPEPPSAAISSSSLTGDVPLTVSFNGSGSTGDITSYSWTFGDNGSGSGSQVSHSYTTPGTHTATLTTTGPSGTSQDSVTVTVTEPETATYSLHLQWSIPVETGGKVLAGYRLYKEGVQICSTDIPTATNMDCSFESAEGTFAFTLTSIYTDDSESSHSTPYTFTLSPTAEPGLVAEITTTPVSLSGVVPFQVTLDAAGSSGDIVSYQWDFGDNTSGEGLQTSHTFNEVGTYNAILIVTSSSGAISQSSVTITTTSTPVPPIAQIATTSLTGDAPLTVSFNGTGSTGETTYLWSFGDGDSSTISQPTHIFSLAGTYTTSLMVTSSQGLTDQKTVTVTVNATTPPNTPPNAVISSSTAVGEAPFAINFDGSGSNDAEGDIATYIWSFGDGATATGVSAAYTYTDPGSYTATLTVTDSQSESDIITTPVIITEPTTPNETPVAHVTPSITTGSIPLEVTFSGEASSDPENGSMNYSWNFGDGSTSQGVTTAHTFTTVGTFTVTLTVTDDGGASATATTTITTDDLEPTFHIELDDVEIDHNWVRVDFAETFINPVVVAGPLSYNGSHPSIIRVRNISPTGFEIRLQEWEYLDGSHSLEKVSYLAMEKGRHTLEDGTQIEAGVFQASGEQEKTVQFTSGFTEEPVVITTLLTFGDTKAATSRLKKISDTGFSLSIEEEELSAEAHGEENVGYIAWEPQNSTIGNMKVIVSRTSKAVKHKWYTINYGEQLTEAPLFLAAMAPQLGGNTASIRYMNKTDSSIQVKVEEETSKDSEVRHSRETVGYFIFSLMGQ